MTESYRENLSAAVDGELSGEELRFLLRRLDHDEALRQAWSRYQLAGDGLRRQLTVRASADFADRVLQAVEHSQAAAVPDRRRHWLRWSAGGAIAASVAVAALMVARPAGDESERSAPQVAGASSVAPSQAPMASAGAAAGMLANRGPASVPTWLSGNAASQLSQPASATLGDDVGGALPYSRPLRPYQMQRYRAVRSGDGSYLLLLDPDQPGRGAVDQQAPAIFR